MSEQTDQYIAKRTAFVSARDEVEKLIQGMASVVHALHQNPERFAFSNVPGSAFPPEVIMSVNSVTADAKVWPTAAEINEKLAKLHATKSEMIDAWSRLSDAEQDSMQPPPGVQQERSRY